MLPGTMQTLTSRTCRSATVSFLPPARILCRFKAVSRLQQVTNPVKDDGSQLLTISKARLDQLLQAEVEHLATVPLQPLSMSDILKTRSPRAKVKFIQTDVPRRLAMRLRMIHFLQGWEKVPELVELESQLKKWYEMLTLAPGVANIRDFTARINSIRSEGRLVVGTVATGLRKLKQNGTIHDDKFLDRWIDGFLLSRIGSNLLLDQYRSTVPKEYGGRYEKVNGVIDMKCDANQVCKYAARAARGLCQAEMGRAPAFTIENFVEGKVGPQPPGSCSFSYISGYLRYIVLELLKNSFKATVKHMQDAAELPAVSILICCDDHRVAIRISDRGGGIPFDKGPAIWSYMMGAAADSSIRDATDLAGYGVGLPVSRLHAQYLGGKLHLTTYPGHGTDAHLLLPRIDAEQVEKMPEGTW